MKTSIRKSLETLLLIGSPLVAGSLGLFNVYVDRRGVVKELGWEANTSGSVTYSLLTNGNVLARQHFISRYGIFSPATYEISQDNPRYQRIINGEINGD